jgi:hypothetical protein
MRSILVALLALLFVPLLKAAPLAPEMRAEIDALLSTFQTSGCEFNRNGTWYTAVEAKAHLLRKLEYLESKNAVQSTEQFIELGASTSSASGRPYLVKCGNAAPVESTKWLSAQLKAMRSSGPAAASGPK